MTPPANLDHRAAEDARLIVETFVELGGDAKVLENVVRKALGILQENGPFATVLYLLTRREKEKDAAASARGALLGSACWLANAPNSLTDSSRPLDILKFMNESITFSTERLILISNLWEQTLIYARYAAAAQSK